MFMMLTLSLGGYIVVTRKKDENSRIFHKNIVKISNIGILKVDELKNGDKSMRRKIEKR